MRRGKLLNKETCKCKVAAIQMVSTDSVDTNLATMSAQVRLAVREPSSSYYLNTFRLLGSQRMRKLNGLKRIIMNQVLIRKKFKLVLVMLQRKIVFG